jgi:hypothetical protein
VFGKLGELLNKDMGTLVKDAGKVLNSDVGALAKGAGKVLNADLGDLLRDQPAQTAEKATTDAGTAPPSPSLPPTKPAGRTPPSPQAANKTDSTPVPTAKAPPQTFAPAPHFDADSTLKLAPGGGNDATAILAPGGGATAQTLPQLSDDLLARHTRKMPTGTSLIELLPHVTGEFERPRATPVGDLTSDPVTAMYAVTGHPIALKLVQCWDEDEAREHLTDVKNQAGKNFRMSEDKSWILGETLQGLMFAWTRGNYSFTATAPKGEISMVRFLKAFPY